MASHAKFSSIELFFVARASLEQAFSRPMTDFDRAVFVFADESVARTLELCKLTSRKYHPIIPSVSTSVEGS